MADPRIEVLYAAPSDPLRSPIALFAQSYEAALAKADGVTVLRLLGASCPEALHGQPHGVSWVRQATARRLRGQHPVGEQVLHVDVGRTTQREFWAAQQALRQRPGCALCLLFHDPPYLPEPVQPPAADSRGGWVERLLGIGSFDRLFHGLARRMAEGAYQELERALLERATALLCLSPGAAELLAQRYPRHRQKIGSLRPPLLGPPASGPIEPHQPGENEPVRIACFGRIEPRKAYDDLLRALATLHAESSLVGLVELRILGSLSPRVSATGLPAAIEHAIEKYNLGYLAELLAGFQPEAELDRLLAETDVLVLPYRAGACQSMSRTLLRVAPRAVAVVASDVEYMRELIEPGVTGLLYPPGDVEALTAALRQTIGDGDKRRAMAAALRKRALATHSAEALAPTLRAVYSEIARAHQEKRPVRLPDGVRFEPGAGHA